MTQKVDCVLDTVISTTVRNTEVWEQTKLAREQAEPWRSTWLGKADMLKSKEEQATTANRDNKAGC